MFWSELWLLGISNNFWVLNPSDLSKLQVGVWTWRHETGKGEDTNKGEAKFSNAENVGTVTGDNAYCPLMPGN